VTRLPVPPSLRAVALALAFIALTGCSTIEEFASGDKLDYRSKGNRTAGLEVPPDLTQLARDSRYQPTGGAVSASALQGPAVAPAATAQAATTVAPSQMGDVRIERQGNQRWLVTALTPEQLWPRLQAFWKDSGFTLVIDQPATGIMETEWNENRAKLPQDFIRSTIGRVFDSAYSTGERDKFRTRVERGTGTEVYISHRGVEEVYTSTEKETTRWQPRPADPQLEAAFLSRLMQRLGASEEAAKTAVAEAPVAPARARIVAGQSAATLQVDDNFERAWRRVGLALDRGGFTVEDRDRAQGLYFVRYVDPKDASKADSGFFARLFGRDDAAAALARYRIQVKADGDRSLVTVLTAQGAPEAGPTGQRIVGLLLDELK
jgi:outer membrane protein assembly factor BamC